MVSFRAEGLLGSPQTPESRARGLTRYGPRSLARLFLPLRWARRAPLLRSFICGPLFLIVAVKIVFVLQGPAQEAWVPSTRYLV